MNNIETGTGSKNGENRNYKSKHFVFVLVGRRRVLVYSTIRTLVKHMAFTIKTTEVTTVVIYDTNK